MAPAVLEGLASDLAEKLEGENGFRRKVTAMRLVLRQDDVESSKRRLKDAIRLLSSVSLSHDGKV